MSIPASTDAIVISSDDEEAAPAKRVRHSTRGKDRNLEKSESVAEQFEMDNIPFGTSGYQRKHQQDNMNLRRMLSLAEDEIRRRDVDVRIAKTDIAKALDLATKLRTDLLHETDRITVVFAQQMLDHFSCTLCMDTNWNPHALTCGHIYCARCLADYFSQSLAAYVAENGDAQGALRPVVRLASVPFELLIYENAIHLHRLLSPAEREGQLDEESLEHLETYETYLRRRDAVVDAMSMDYEGPTYDCPQCRAKVDHEPVPLYTLKNIIHDSAVQAGVVVPALDIVAWEGFFSS